jgi:hypothetical protein
MGSVYQPKLKYTLLAEACGVTTDLAAHGADGRGDLGHHPGRGRGATLAAPEPNREEAGEELRGTRCRGQGGLHGGQQVRLWQRL